MMETLKKYSWILGIIAIIAIGAYGTYNALFALDTEADLAWANVEGQYQRRADLIPNLTATVKGLADQEVELFESVTKARAEATKTEVNIDDPASVEKFMAAQGNVTSALSRLLVTVENYPELKSNKAFEDMMVQLEGTENRIAVARGKYNDAIKEFELVRRSPRHVLFSRFFFNGKDFFEAQEGSENAPVVDFGE